MKQERIIYSVWGSGAIVLLGMILLLFPLLNILDLTFVYRLFLGVFSIISLIQFVIQYKDKEWSSFLIFLVSILLLCSSFLWNLAETPKIFSLTLLIWILFVSLARAKRADFFHDRKSKVWCLEMGLLVLFFLAGVLTCANFAFRDETSILLMGYFTFFCGVLDFQENMLIYLTRGKIK